MPRRNPPRPAPPPRRAGNPTRVPTSTLARVRKMAREVDERDRPFSPERPPTWRGSANDLVVNGARMDDFTHGFLETALWSSNDNSDDTGGDPLDKNYGIEDFAEPALRGLIADCERFQKENAADLAVAYEQGIRGADFNDQGAAGHDFWLTRCGHGAGFWDGDYPEPQATRLTKASEKFGNVDLYVGDDGKIWASGYESGTRQGFRENTRRKGGHRGMRSNSVHLELPVIEPWEQVDGDMDPGGHGAIIARSDGTTIELLEIQPVREFVGDGEAADVGFPFWTREASYDLSDLSPENSDVKSALRSSGLDLEEFDTPRTRALAVAIALFRYGHGVGESDGGWSTDIVQFPVKWWASTTPQTFEEFCGDEDSEFRREVLGEGYTYKMTYETWNEEALEAGETDDKGWEEEGSDVYGSLEDVIRATDDHSWIEWSSSPPDGRSWIISEDDEDHRTGDRTIYNLWIERTDKKPLSADEIDTISKAFGIRVRK